MMGQGRAMRESGVAWIGEMPVAWTIDRIGNVLAQKKKVPLAAEVLSLSYGEIKIRNVSSNAGLMPETFDTYQGVSAGDVVLRLTDLQNDMRSIRVARSSLVGRISPAYLVLSLKSPSITSDWSYWVLLAVDITKHLYSLGGGVRQSMKYSDIAVEALPLPSIPEQCGIAAYLERETTLIDQEIALIERKVALLAEYRKAIIFEAVTKGLDKTADMKDSGVDWVGQIPSGWGVARVSEIGRVVKTLNTGMKCVNRLALTMHGVVARSMNDLDGLQAKNFESYQIFENGDIVFKLIDLQNISTSRVGLVPRQGIMSPAYIRLSLKKGVSNRYFFYQFYSAYLNQVYNSMGGGVRQALGREDLLSFNVVVPSATEQEEIADFIDGRLAEVEEESRLLTQKVTLLAEYRKALIFEAVTGKVEVPSL